MVSGVLVGCGSDDWVSGGRIAGLLVADVSGEQTAETSTAIPSVPTELQGRL
jgi:hypothetical protein